MRHHDHHHHHRQQQQLLCQQQPPYHHASLGPSSSSIIEAVFTMMTLRLIRVIAHGLTSGMVHDRWSWSAWARW
jgi:hypothetical protein